MVHIHEYFASLALVICAYTRSMAADKHPVHTKNNRRHHRLFVIAQFQTTSQHLSIQSCHFEHAWTSYYETV